MDWVFRLEPGVGVEPTLAIRDGMFTTGCYEPRLQPVALSDRPSVDKPTPAWFGPRQKQGPDRRSYKLDEAGFPNGNHPISRSTRILHNRPY